MFDRYMLYYKGMSIYRKFAAFFLIAITTFISSSFLASAAEGEVDFPNPLGTNSVIVLIGRIVRFFYAIAIPLAIIMIIYVGILFLTAGGNEEQLKKAKKTMIWIAVGIAVILIGRGVITLIKDILGVL